MAAEASRRKEHAIAVHTFAVEVLNRRRTVVEQLSLMSDDEDTVASPPSGALQNEHVTDFCFPSEADPG